MSSALVRSASRAVSLGTRRLHTTPPCQAGGYDYLHAKYMFNFRNKPASKAKAGAAIFGGLALGIYIPIFAVDFNQKKAGLK